MKAGPKGAVDESPLPFDCDLTGVERFAAWCERFLIVPKGVGVNEPMRLRDWQVEMLRPFLDPDPRPVIGTCAVAIPSISESGSAKSSVPVAILD